ncbi:MAG: hypothetical protein U0075_14645 [Thermomicrobiales bacterium]
MDLVPFPALRPYGVWFLPDNRTPLRIGSPMGSYDDACQLAQDAARDLPAYGIRQGLVSVMWSASNLQILNTFAIPTVTDTPEHPAQAALAGAPRPEILRLALEDLRHLTSLEEPRRAAPFEWIHRVHAVLQGAASPARQRQYRLDGLYGVTMEDLHRYVSGALRNFDHLVAASALATSPAGEDQP